MNFSLKFTVILISVELNFPLRLKSQRCQAPFNLGQQDLNPLNPHIMDMQSTPPSPSCRLAWTSPLLLKGVLGHLFFPTVVSAGVEENLDKRLAGAESGPHG